MSNLAPEDKRVMRLPGTFLEGKSVAIFYEGVRSLQKRMMMIEMGVDEVTPYDKFFLIVAREIWHNGFSGGTHGTPPDDVVDILNRLFAKR
jgi:hypothetical protein